MLERTPFEYWVEYSSHRRKTGIHFFTYLRPSSNFNVVDSVTQGLRPAYRRRTFTGALQQVWSDAPVATTNE